MQRCTSIWWRVHVKTYTCWDETKKYFTIPIHLYMDQYHHGVSFIRLKILLLCRILSPNSWKYLQVYLAVGQCCGCWCFGTEPQSHQHPKPWWHHQMEAFSALLALCAGNSPVTGEFPAQKPVKQSFDAYFDVHLNKRLSKQLWGWLFETSSCPLWRHCNVTDMAAVVSAKMHT